MITLFTLVISLASVWLLEEGSRSVWSSQLGSSTVLVGSIAHYLHPLSNLISTEESFSTSQIGILSITAFWSAPSALPSNLVQIDFSYWALALTYPASSASYSNDLMGSKQSINVHYHGGSRKSRKLILAVGVKCEPMK